MTGEAATTRRTDRQHFAIAYLPSGKSEAAVFDFPSRHEFEAALAQWRMAGYAIKVFDAETGCQISGYAPDGTFYEVMSEKVPAEGTLSNVRVSIRTVGGRVDHYSMHACPQCGVYHPDARIRRSSSSNNSSRKEGEEKA